MKRALLMIALANACTGTTRAPTEDAPPAPALVWPPAGTDPARNAIVIVLDTTRADALQAARTPHIDQLAASGASVPRAWSGGTWTVPSVVSLLTGNTVLGHGWDEPAARLGQYPPLPDLPRLPEVLRNAGFSTTGLYANPYLSEPLGFDRGFDTWKRTSDTHIATVFGNHVRKHWADPSERHFAYLHVLGPHSPLRPSPEAAARWDLDSRWVDEKMGFTVGAAKRNTEPGVRDAYRKAYHAALEDTDSIVESILLALGPHRASTLVVVTSDHGEMLGEHDQVGHGWWLWEPLTHVPLVVDHPYAAEEALPSMLSNAAVPDLVCRGLGIPATWPVRVEVPSALVAQREGRVALLTDEGRTKTIWDTRIADPGPARFDLTNDPQERIPLPANPADMSQMESLRAHVPKDANKAGRIPLSTETQAQLEALGYQE